jgi:general secretion pathway protein G
VSRALSLVLWIIIGGFVLLIFVLLLGSPSSSSKTQRVKADFTSLSSALESYRKTTGDYPTTDQGLMALVSRPETLPAESDWQNIATKIPADPWKQEYQYLRLPDSSPRAFELRSNGPDGIAGNEDDRVSE